MVFFFFFSSRRRHTRYIGDWSSDVCSSDLRPPRRDARSGRSWHWPGGGEAIGGASRRQRRLLQRGTGEGQRVRRPPAVARMIRSEERRVGKECRSGWAGAGGKHDRRSDRGG